MCVVRILLGLEMPCYIESKHIKSVMMQSNKHTFSLSKFSNSGIVPRRMYRRTGFTSTHGYPTKSGQNVRFPRFCTYVHSTADEFGATRSRPLTLMVTVVFLLHHGLMVGSEKREPTTIPSDAQQTPHSAAQAQ